MLVSVPFYNRANFFVLVTVLGFFAARFLSSEHQTSSHSLDERGLGGRQFGKYVTWFFVGGDFYTAYSVIAVPALVFAVGAYGFFALPYTILVYPFVYLVMPKLWSATQASGLVTVRGCTHGSSRNHVALYTFSSGLRAPAYTLLLGMIALLGFMAIAAGITAKHATEIVPKLFDRIFPEWFAGFAFAAIAIGALVPAAVMSIGASNLFTRNLWKPLVNPSITPEGETQVAKIVSLVVKLGALVCIVFLPTQFAIDLQLLGGIWMLQISPSVVFGLFLKKIDTTGLFWGWCAGIVLGTSLAFSSGILKPVYGISLGCETFIIYIGLIALLLNCVIAFAFGLKNK